MNKNKYFTDKTLSLQAKGLLITIMMMSDEADLMDCVKESDTIIKSATKELIDKGLIRVAVKKENEEILYTYHLDI